MNILFKNKDFIACVKPQGIPSQPDPSGCVDMTALLSEELIKNGEKSDIFVVHRLDRSTGGLIIYARNKEAAAAFSRLVAEKDGFQKEYLAVISGMPENESGNMTDYLLKDSAQKKAFVVKSERKGAKLASLDFKTLQTVSEDDKIFSLLRITLNTGRFHQIRAQLSSRGMPIYGDGKYGSREKAPNFALWASKITFIYKGKSYEFESAPDLSQKPWSLFE